MASVSVSFDPPVNTGNDAPIVSYTVVAMPGNISASGPASPITVSGLSYGVPYTFTVTAYNSLGASYPSTPVSLTLSAVPEAPLGLSAVGGESLAVVTFTAPNDNGSPIIQYTMESTPGGITATGIGSPITVTGLTDGTSYTFSATATNANGTGPASGPSNAIIPGTPPLAPTIGSATAYNGYATVAFTPNGTGGSPILEYVAVSTPGGFVGSGVASPVTINGLTNGTAYTFDVVAINAIGTSAPSAQSNAVTPGLPATVPGQPTNVAAIGGNAQATVTFTAPSSGGSPITGYTVTSSPGGITGAGTASPIVVTGLTNGTPYTFTVTATNGVGTGTASTPSNSVTPAAVPGAPTSVVATAGNLSASVAFTAPASTGGAPISQYTATSSPGGFIGTGSASPVVVSGLTKEVSYTFTVTATNATGIGPASAPSAAVTPYGVPAAPTAVSTASGNGQLLVTFTAPDNGGSAITGYTVVANPGGFTATGAASPLAITGLTNGTAYTVIVTATNLAGTGPSSAGVLGTPSTLPLAPTSVVATSGETPSTSAITVSGHRLVDSLGNTWIGHGANFSGLETAGPEGYQPWYGKTVPWSTYATYNPNVVRIPLCAATILQLNCLTINATGNGWVSTTTKNADPFGNTVAALDAAIANAQAFGCAVILDLHWSAPSFTFAGVTAYAMPEFAPAFANSVTDLLFWQFIAGRYGTQATPQPGINNARILFELFNEPYLDQYETGAPLYALMKNGGTLASFKTNGVTTDVAQSWTVLGYQQMLNAIRALGATNVCIVNGPGYSSSCSGIASYMPADTLNPAQLAGGLHPYGNAATWAAEATNFYPGIHYDAGSTGVNWWKSTQAAITAGYPMLFTECGDFYGQDASGTAPCLNEVCTQAAALGVSGVVVWEFFQERAGDPGTPTSGQFVSITSTNTPTENQGAYLLNYLQSFILGTPFVTVSFVAPNNEGSPITGYTATSSPGGLTATGTASPLTVTGVALNTTYTFGVTATNANGTGPAGTSNPITIVATTPTPPLSPSATPGNTVAYVAFSAPASNGGDAIFNYTVTASPGGATANGLTSPLTVSGLTNGTPYTFTVTATNVIGTSAPSASTVPIIPSTVPGAPTGVVGTVGNGQISVAFVAPNNGGLPITGYTVVASPGNITASGTASPIVVTGLTNGQSYTFTVTAMNANGNGPASNPSNSVVPATVPDAPQSPSAVPGNTQATISFSPPNSNGGATITTYTALSSPGNFKASAASSPITVTGLTNNVSYTFTVTAINAIGTSVPSVATLPVTPVTPPGFIITTTAEPNGAVGVAYSGQVTAAGSTFTPYTYANTTAMPPGLSLNTTNGAITGTPTSSGTFTTGFQATDSSGTYTVPVATIVANNDGTGNTVDPIPGDQLVTVSSVPLVANGPVMEFGSIACYNAAHNARTLTTSPSNTWVLEQDIQGPTSAQNPNAINASQETAMWWCAAAAAGTTTFTNYWGSAGDADYPAAWAIQFPVGTVLIGSNSAAQTGTQWAGVPQGTQLGSGYISVAANQVPCRLYGFCENTSQSGNGWLPTPSTVIEQTSGTVVGTMTLLKNIWNFDTPSAGYTTCVAYIDITAPGNYQATFNQPSSSKNCSQTFGFIVQGPGTGGATTPVKNLSFTITGTGLPNAPTIGTVVAGNGQVQVNFTPSTSSGGSPITSYTAVSTPGNIKGTGGASATSITVSGLTNGVSYTFKVYATNANGNGPSSAASAAAIPGAPAAAFLSYLVSIKGSDILVGQHTQYYEGNTNSVSEAYTTITPLLGLTGQLPAIIGVTANFYGTYGTGNPLTDGGGGIPSLNTTAQIITDYCSAATNAYKGQTGSGVVQINMGWQSPNGVVTVNPIGSAGLAEAVTVGSAYYNSVKGQVAILQSWLLGVVATNPNCVLMIRFLAELNSGFWYGVQNTQTDINNQITLHRQVWNALFSGAGAALRNNVLVVYNENGYGAYGKASCAAFPGTAYADMCALDVYDPNWNYPNGSIQSDALANMQALGLPFGFCECANASPSAAPPPNTVSNLTIPQWMRAHVPSMVWFAQWNDNGQAPNSMGIYKQLDASTMMNEPYIITLTDLPSFNSLPSVTPPSAVSAFTLTGQTQNTQTFQWTLATAGTNPIQSQNIYRTPTTNGVVGTRTKLANVSASTTSYTDTTATNSLLNTSFNNGPTVVYSYDVTAVDSAGNEGPTQPQMYAWLYYQGKACFLDGDYSIPVNGANYKSTAVSVPAGTYCIAVPNTPPEGTTYWQPYTGLPGNGSGTPITDQTFGTGCPIWAMETGAFNYLTMDIQPQVSGASYRINVISRLFNSDVFNNAAFIVGGSAGAYGPATVAGQWGTYKIPLASIAGSGIGTHTASISGTTLNITADLTGPTAQSGGWVIGTGVTANTAIAAPSPGGGAAPISLTVSNSQTVGSRTLTIQRTNSYKISFFDYGTENGYYVNNFGFTRT